MKRKLYIPLLTLGLCAALLTVCSQEAEAHHTRTQRIAVPQSGTGYGSHYASIHVNELQHHTEEHIYYNHVPARGECLMINPETYLATAQSGTVISVPEGVITESQARSIALEHAGLKETDVIYLYSKLDEDDGVLVYEVEFCTGSKQYDYDIHASNGTILDYDYEIEGGHHHTMSGNTITPPAGYIAEADAINTALNHADVQEADVSFIKVKLEYDDGVLAYEVEFYVGNKEYDYEIDAATGTIRSYDYDIDEDFKQETVSSSTLSEADAKKLVLAKVSGASESHIRDFKLDRDDGRLVYEGELRYNGMEYEFEIDAATGTFLEWDADEDD